MTTEDKKQPAIERLQAAIPYFRGAILDVKQSHPDSTVKMAIIAEHADGGGQVIMRFECEELFEDIATVVDAPAFSKDDDLQYRAHKFLSQHGLTVNSND